MDRIRLSCTLGLTIVLLVGLLANQAKAGTVRSDFDHDCDVDSADLAHLRMCTLGSVVPQFDPLCADTRLDADDDVDMDDFGIFQRCYSGEGREANPNCDAPCAGPDCNCPCGQTSCSGTCKDTRTDNTNCGACGNVCGAGLVCQNGTCSPCPPPTTDCGGYCVFLDHNLDNCGSCGHACAGGSECYGGECHEAVPPEVPQPTGSSLGQARPMVPGDFDHDCDVDFTDLVHLRLCARGPTVSQMELTCADARLDGDLDIDLDDFGILQRCYSGAGNPAHPNCNGTCSGDGCACLCGHTSCNGACTSTASDNANCGACGHVCAAGTTCLNGSCSATACFGGQLLCNGICREVQLDPANCGSCGHQCNPGENCVGGVCLPAECDGCEPTCPEGGAWCGGACIDVSWDALNCGACGNRCGPQEFCSFGRCEGVCIRCE